MTQRNWTAREVKQLESLARMNYRDHEIAALLHRSRMAVQRKRLDLGIESLVHQNSLARMPVGLTLWVSQKFDERVREFCEEHGASPSDFIESLVNNFMESLEYQPEENENDKEIHQAAE